MKGKHSALVQPEEVGPAYGQALNSVSHMGSNIAHQRGNGSRSGFLYLQVPTQNSLCPFLTSLLL